MSTRKHRRDDGSLRPTYARHRARRRKEKGRVARAVWLAEFNPGDRERFFKWSTAPEGAVFLRPFARDVGLPDDEAAPLLERTANERGWMKLRTRDGKVVGIAPPRPVSPSNDEAVPDGPTVDPATADAGAAVTGPSGGTDA